MTNEIGSKKILKEFLANYFYTIEYDHLFNNLDLNGSAMQITSIYYSSEY